MQVLIMDKKWWQTVIEGFFMIAWYAFLGALIQALQSLRTKKVPLISVFIEFLTAVSSGTLFGLLSREAGLKDFYTFSIVAATSLFSSKLLPIIEAFVTKYVTKKGKDVIRDSDNN